MKMRTKTNLEAESPNRSILPPLFRNDVLVIVMDESNLMPEA